MPDPGNEAPQPAQPPTAEDTSPSPASPPASGANESWPPPRFTPHTRSFRDSLFLTPEGHLRAGWAALSYLALCLLIVLVAARIAVQLGHSLIVSILSPADLFNQELLQIIAALGAAALMARVENRSFTDFGLPFARAFQGRFWQGALWGLAQISAMMLLIAAFHGYSFGARAIAGAAILRYGLEWAGAFLLVGFFEEFFFRGYLLATLDRGIGFWPAAILLSLAFGAVHLANPGEGPVGAAAVFVVGMFLCLTLRRTGNLWFAIGWHAAFDFGETYLYSVPDSGIVARHQLLAASLHGPRWLTGGSVGPEGSVFAFATLALAALLFDRLYRPRTDSAV